MGNTEGKSEVWLAFLLLFHWDTTFSLEFGIVSNCWIFFLPEMVIFSYFLLLLWIQSQLEEAGIEVKLQLKKVFNLYFRDEQKKDPIVQANAETQRERFIGKINPTHLGDEKWILLGRICFYFKDNLSVLKVEIVGIFKFNYLLCT